MKLRDPEAYVNANYISGLQTPRDYVACNAPVPEAMTDFWHMILSLEINVIVMLTNVVEKGRRKADVYWQPQHMPPDWTIELVETQDFRDYVVRKFSLVRPGSAATAETVHQIQLTNWPDHGVFQQFHVLESIMELMHELKSGSSNGPILIHCSAGIGRSGTFIAMDILHQTLATLRGSSLAPLTYEQELVTRCDVSKLVTRLRLERDGMVQTPEQYQMIYSYVLTKLTSSR